MQKNKLVQENQFLVTLQKHQYCSTHQLRALFFCLHKCNTFLCQKCFLNHKQHADYVIVVDDLIKQIETIINHVNIQNIKNSLFERQQKNNLQIQNLSEQIFQIFSQHKIEMKQQFYQKNSTIKFDDDFKILFYQYKNQSKLINKIKIAKKLIQLQKLKEKPKFNINVNVEILQQKFLKILQKNCEVLKTQQDLNTLQLQIKKVLHWFQWEQREINFVDVSTLNHIIIKLITPFKILPFSRSIVTPEGQIFLIGGETQPSYNKTNFLFSIQNSEYDQSLYEKAPLIEAVFDFASAYYKGFIYVFGGKNKYKNIQNICQCYNIKQNSWVIKKNSLIKRYAHSAFVIQETQKIYIIGGRDIQNVMLSNQIEIYDINKDEWELKVLKLPNFSIPVEIPCSIQIKPYKALIFGGLDSTFQEKKNCYIFNSKKFTLKKTKSLKQKSAFVNYAIKKGNFVYALKNTS